VVRLLQLDVLRVVAVFLVLGRHMSPCPPDLHWLTQFVTGCWQKCGWVGVDLFFVLSGFLVSGLLFREFQHSGVMDFRRFLIRRGLKIYPAFYCFLLVSSVFFAIKGDGIRPSALLCEALFVQNYGASIWGYTWSLAIEEHFYLMLCLLFFVLLRLDRGRPFKHLTNIFLATAILVLLLRIVTSLTVPYSKLTHLFPTHLRLDSLFFGVLLAYFFHFKPHRLEFVRRRKLIALVLSLALVSTSLVLGPEQPFMRTLGLTFLYAGFGGCLLTSMYTDLPRRGHLGRLLAAVGFVGTHSYSIYLWHFPALMVAEKGVRRVLGESQAYYPTFVVYLITSVAFGIVMAKVVEFPVLRLRDRWFPPKSPAGTEKAAQPRLVPIQIGC
jgi:peptidoglycan/LPS O-acetylase OafA/YrhL